MKKSVLATAVVMAMGVGAAQAATTHTYAGTMEFYDASGTLAFVDPAVVGAFDLPGGTGSFTSGNTFNGFHWTADVVQMYGYDTNVGGVQNFNFKTDSIQWFYTDGTNETCHEVTGSGTCAPNPGKTVLFTPGLSLYADYAFSLTNAGQFAAGTFFDWSTNQDIPVLSVQQITSVSPSGVMTTVSVDSDGDGILGTAMLTSPFPDQQPSFNGTLTPVPVPAAVWLFGSGLLGLVGVARRKKSVA
ncbi:MAG: VPLPA-CTERM sorting domain-containing protein [Gammaproteobacteria bacterium]|nr:VPLPA-CTERM sorting domain-containing protein [Gammaproteobacteria bacterium]